ncbi:MAG: hypothetical protein KF765_10505 [Parvibaculaceae bacterium]|nr:hypothetical protein [Parvibaculaceae bacterium]
MQAALGRPLPAAGAGLTGPKSVWPLVAVFTVFFCAILGLLVAGTAELDRFAHGQTRSLAQTAIAKALGDVAFVARDYSFWDASVENLIRNMNPDWADDNVGTYAWEELGMSRSLVLGPGNMPLYWMKEGETSSSDALFSLAPSLLRLAGRARETSWSDPRAVSAFIRLDGGIFIVSASVITPEKPAPKQIGMSGRGVLFFFREIDEDRLAEMSASYLLDDLTLLSAEAEGDFDSLPLEDDSGSTIALLGWKPPSPGFAFLRQTAPWVSVILLVFAGLMVVALKRAYLQAATVARLNDELIHRSTDLERSRSELTNALDGAVKANKAKSDFLAIMSHELRTPLNAVIGFSDLIRNQTFGPVGHRKYIEYGNDIHTSGQHLLSLISDILDVTRANEGTLALECRPVNLSSLVSKCLTIVTQQAVRRRIAVDVVERNAPNIVMGDEVRLTQILTNLVSNAVKASREGSRIRIRISAAAHGIALRVIDNGSGIPKHELGTVTEPFRQAGSYQSVFNPYSSENAGTGLGLAIVKRLTEAHGGQLRILSKVGLGTVVEVTIPRAEEIPCRKTA